MAYPNTAECAHLGKSLAIKGELSGGEDIYIDGQLEGSIELHGNDLMVGPSGRVRANVNARTVVVEGKLEGNIHASERAELKKSAVTLGDIVAQRVAIEDGAYYKGKIDTNPKAASSVSHANTSGVTSSQGGDGTSAASWPKPHGS